MVRGTQILVGTLMTVTSLIFIGCALTQDATLEGNKALIRRMNEEVWNKGNLEIVDEIFSVDFVQHFLPEEKRSLVPSAMAMGIGGVVPASNCVSMFLGALAAWIWTKKSREAGERYRIPAASGLIAGEALMAVAIILFAFAPDLIGDLRETLLGKK